MGSEKEVDYYVRKKRPHEEHPVGSGSLSSFGFSADVDEGGGDGVSLVLLAEKGNNNG
jgi:hypothetical protein